MKLSSAFQCALGGALIGASWALQQNLKTRHMQSSQANILAYEPLTQVTDAAAIDMDQIALESMLYLGTQDAMAQALLVYRNGSFSGSFARLTLTNPLSPAIDLNLTAGTLVVGESFEGEGEVRGVLMAPVAAGDTEMLVRYETGDSQRNHVGCKVGGSPNPVLVGCFAPTGTILVENLEDASTFTFSYSYNVLVDNRNDRTLQSLSTTAKANLNDCANCPYDYYQKFYRYYGHYDYGNKWIMSAFNREPTTFANGNADFSGYMDDESVGIVEAIQKGTVFLNLHMEVVKSMENAVDKCYDGDTSMAKSWDEAVAFYVGSVAKVTNGDEGVFLYSNARKRCRNFGTCGKSNDEIFDQFMLGQLSLEGGGCEDVELAKNRILNLMTVPFIQGALRFAFLMDKEGVMDPRADASSAAFAASILPLVHSCNPADAQIVYSNMRVGATSVSFADVKSALERNYPCMGLTCANVGGLLSDDGYISGAEPCDDSTFDFNDSTQDAPESVSSNIIVTSNETDAQEVVDWTAEAPDVTTWFAVNETTPSTAVDESPSSSICAPCVQTLEDEPIAASKRLSECPLLLEQERDTIAKDCECACFVDSEFAFCANDSNGYTGSGSVVGPCEVELKYSLVEEDATEMEDLIEEEPEDSTPPPSATDVNTVDDDENIEEELEDSTPPPSAATVMNTVDDDENVEEELEDSTPPPSAATVINTVDDDENVEEEPENSKTPPPVTVGNTVDEDEDEDEVEPNDSGPVQNATVATTADEDANENADEDVDEDADQDGDKFSIAAPQQVSSAQATKGSIVSSFILAAGALALLWLQ